MTNSNGDSTTGTGAVVSAIISGIAIVSAMHPKWTWLVLLAAHAPDLTNVLPIILGALGAIGGMISHPPAWMRTPWDRLKLWIAAHFRKKVAP